jgi:CRP-like cAMP-binding protein
MNISDFALFSKLLNRETARIAKIARKFQFIKGERIISKGSHIDLVYFLRSGCVKESTCTRSGKEIVFNMHSKGDCLGLVCALNLETSKSDYVATKDSSVYAIRINEFRLVMQTCPALSQALLAEFGKVALKFSDKLYEIRALDVAERTRAELLRYASKNTDASHSTYVEMVNLPTHEEIANSVFTHREAVTKEISNLKKIGVVIKTEKNLLAANVHLLQKMIEEYS